MEFGQKIGAAIVMGIPTIVGGGILMDIFHSWAVVVLWIALMPVVYWAIITGKFSCKHAEQDA